MGDLKKSQKYQYFNKTNKNDNEVRMQSFDNPRLRSAHHNNSFQINIHSQNELNKNEIMEYYEANKKDSIDWQSINTQNIFNYRKIKKINVHNIINEENASEEDDINEEDINEENDNDDQVTLDNLETNFSPFANPVIAETYITKANKGYRLVHEEANDRTKFSLKLNVYLKMMDTMFISNKAQL